METTRKCTRCGGDGRIFHRGFTTADGAQTYPDEWRECYACGGLGEFPAPGFTAILKTITTNKDGHRQFRKSAPKHGGMGSLAGNRAYFVWRIARFYGGADVCMPITAETLIDGDPYYKELSDFAEAVARRVFGTDMAAACRWGTALGCLDHTPDGLSASAYPGGPVADGNKPIEEAMELR